MANKILVKTDATPIVWAADVDYDGGGGAQTHTIGLAALLAGAARQGDKADLDTGGSAVNRFPAKFTVTLRLDMAAAPGADVMIKVYWAHSTSSVAATANPGGCTGVDGAYTGTAGSTVAESVKQLQYLGSLMLTADGVGVVQQQTFSATLPTQWGSPVVHNLADEDIRNDNEGLSLTLTPYEYEVQ